MSGPQGLLERVLHPMNRPSHPNIMPSDETSLLMPEVNSLNWRRKCCKHLSRWCFLWIVYALLLVTEVAVSIYFVVLYFLPYFKGTDASHEKITSDETTSSPGPHFFLPTIPQKQDPGNETADNAKLLITGCIFDGLNILNCWILLGIVVTSPRFVGCLTTLRNLIRFFKVLDADISPRALRFRLCNLGHLWYESKWIVCCIYNH